MVVLGAKHESGVRIRLVRPVFQLGVLPGLVGPSNDHVTDGFQSESDEWRIRVPIWSAHIPSDARGGS